MRDTNTKEAPMTPETLRAPEYNYWLYNEIPMRGPDGRTIYVRFSHTSRFSSRPERREYKRVEHLQDY